MALLNTIWIAIVVGFARKIFAIVSFLTNVHSLKGNLYWWNAYFHCFVAMWISLFHLDNQQNNGQNQLQW